MHHSCLCTVLINGRSSDVDAAARFWGEAPGRSVDRLERSVVMQAPTGQCFCVVRVQRSGFLKNADRGD